MAVTCELCPKPALGRCTQCRQPFCVEHKGRGPAAEGRGPLCGACAVELAKEMARQQRESGDAAERAERAPITKRLVDAVGAAAEAGVLPTVRPKRFTGSRKTRWGNYKTVYEEQEPAWPVGQHPWVVTWKNEPRRVDESTGVTAQGEIVAMRDDHPAREFKFNGDPEKVASEIEAIAAFQRGQGV